MDIVLFEDLSALLGLEGLDIDEYPALKLIRASVTSAIENHLGRYLELTEYTLEQWGNGQDSSLPALPVVSVASVTVTEGCGAVRSLPASDYVIAPWGLTVRNYELALNARIVVIWYGGYADGTLPADIRRAALLQTSYEWQAKDAIGAETVSTEGGTISRPSLRMLPEVKRLLEPHKHPLKLS